MSGFLWSILAILTLQSALWEEPQTSEASDVGWSLMATWGVTLLLVLLQHRRRGRSNDTRTGRLRGVFVPLLAFAAICHGLGYPQALRQVPGLSWPFVSTAAALAPYLVLRRSALRANRGRSEDGAAALGREGLGRLQAQVELLPFVPFVFFDGASALAGEWYVSRIVLQHVTGLQVAVALLGMLVLLEGLPLVVPWVWKLRPLPAGDVRRLLEEVARSCGFRCRELYLWPTGRTMANAAIMGLGPKRRIVVLTDLLLERLGPAELAAVFAHEVGHARRRHLVAFLGLGVLFVFALGTSLTALEDGPLARWLARSCDPAESGWIGLGLGSALVLLAFGALFFVTFGRLSRACETEADLHALEVMGEPHALARALLLVVGPERAARERRGWRHESPATRIRFLQRCAVDRGHQRAFERRLRGWKAALALGCLAGVVWAGVSYARELPGELAVASLAFGAYDAAEFFGRSLPSGDAGEVRALAGLGRRSVVASESRTEGTQRLWSRATEALAAGDLSEGSDLLLLARLREGTVSPERTLLLRAVWLAVELRDAGFREPEVRWRRRLGKDLERLPESIGNGILKAFEGSAGGGSREPAG